MPFKFVCVADIQRIRLHEVMELRSQLEKYKQLYHEASADLRRLEKVAWSEKKG